MRNDSLNNYVNEITSLIKERAKKAKEDADNSKEGEESFNNGFLMAYHQMIATMKNQALAFDLNQEAI